MKSVGSISLLAWLTMVSVGCETRDNIVGDVLFQSGNNPLEPGDGSHDVGGSVGVTTVTTPLTGSGGSTGTSKTKTLGTGGTTTVATSGVGGTTPLLTTLPSTNPGGCSEKTDFVEIASQTATKNLVLTLSNDCKIIGAFYAYGDNAGTLKQPLQLESGSTNYASPCTDEGCCIAGTTSLWTQMSSDGVNPTYAEWGAGLGFSLGDSGNGLKFAYSGPVKGFTFKTSGELNGQRVSVKVYHTSAFTEEMPPLVEMPELGTWTVKFTDATCANYPYTEPHCIDSTFDVFDLFIQVDGGNAAGDFKLCLTSLTPIF